MCVWDSLCVHIYCILHQLSCRDALIEQLMREIVDLKEQIANLEAQRNADHELMAGLREKLQQMEAELQDYKEIAEQTCSVR